MKIIATFLLRDGFRRREIIDAKCVQPRYSIVRTKKINFRMTALPSENDPNFEKIDFVLVKAEKGANDIIYATYEEM